ncbi:MAG TPA: O-antigen ligase family protein, partial [Blastocatellia bacterium]|nr:O-antigen ligase family protein [Blastocatellia bacterium]
MILHDQTQPHPSRLLRAVALMLAPLSALSSVVAFGVTSGGDMLRALMLSGALWLMALPVLFSLEAGMLAMLLFEPMRGFLRRAQFIFVEYTTTDPIHLVTPVITILAFTILLWKRREQLFVAQPLGIPVTLLGISFGLQIFNPFQGGLFVGLSGAMFILLPMAWFYFGRAMHTTFMTTAMHLIVVMGLLCSLHGVYQLLIGFPSFEQYWIAHTDHYESIQVGHVQRALATFNSAEEWGRYVQYGALIAFGFALGTERVSRRWGWLLSFASLVVMLMITGQRTAIFGLASGLGTLILIGATSWSGTIKRALLLGTPVLLVLALAQAPSADEMWGKGKDEKVSTILSHTARGTLQPAKEKSLEHRFQIWTRLITHIIPSRPLGTGLGAGTVAAARYADPTDELYPIDSFVAVLLVGCSLPVALLFSWLMARVQIIAIRTYQR